MNLKIIPSANRAADMIHALRLQMRRTEVQSGCVQCRISRDAQEQNIILYQEEWSSWEDLERHVRSDRFFWILELIEQSTNTPELSFCDIRETRGMEYVRKLRTVNPN